jgi:hypothetical protein
MAPTAMPSNVPQMPRPSMIPHTATPQPTAPKQPPRGTLMGFPAINPANLPPGAVQLPIQPPPKPQAWAPPAPVVPKPPTSVPGPAMPTAALGGAPVVQPIHDDVSGEITAAQGPKVGSPLAAAVAERAAREVSQEIAARGPEYEALAKVSREVIERICWEIIPELAETIIKEQLDRLVREKQG